MSLSFESLALRRKRTATERAENNGDPLVVKKKAREAAKSNMAASTSTRVATAEKPAPTGKKGPNVRAYAFQHVKNPHTLSDQPAPAEKPAPAGKKGPNVSLYSFQCVATSHTLFNQPIKPRRHSVHMEEVDDEDDLPRNVAPLNESHILGLSDGSDDDHEPRVPGIGDMDIEEDDDDDPCPPLEVDDEDEDDDDEDKEDEDEESAEAELGQFYDQMFVLY